MTIPQFETQDAVEAIRSVVTAMKVDEWIVGVQVHMGTCFATAYIVQPRGPNPKIRIDLTRVEQPTNKEEER